MACSACRKKAKNVKRSAPAPKPKTRSLTPRKVINPRTAKASISYNPTQPQSKKEPPRAKDAIKLK